MLAPGMGNLVAPAVGNIVALIHSKVGNCRGPRHASTKKLNIVSDDIRGILEQHSAHSLFITTPEKVVEMSTLNGP